LKERKGLNRGRDHEGGRVGGRGGEKGGFLHHTEKEPRERGDDRKGGRNAGKRKTVAGGKWRLLPPPTLKKNFFERSRPKRIRRNWTRGSETYIRREGPLRGGIFSKKSPRRRGSLGPLVRGRLEKPGHAFERGEK